MIILALDKLSQGFGMAYRDNVNRPAGRIILPRILTQTFDQLPEPCFIKDINSSYIYSNQATASLFSLRSPADMLYKQEQEFHSPLTKNEYVVEQWQLQDKKVINSQKPLMTLEIHPHAVKYPYLLRKNPFYDDNNHCCGIISYVRTLEVYTLKDFTNGNSPCSLLLTKPDTFFSEKECEIIFLKLQGMTSKDVGYRLHRSPRTIDNYLMRLYNKTGVNHFEDFSEFCHQHNYHRYLPRRFLLELKGVREKKSDAFLNRIVAASCKKTWSSSDQFL